MEAGPQRASTIAGMDWAQKPDIDLSLMDVAKQKRYIARVQDALAAELALAPQRITSTA